MTACTDDERREVARRLRGNPEDTLIPHRTGRHHGMGCREAADRFWNMCDRIKEAGNYDIAFSTTSVLADLIDPGEDVSASAYDLLPQEDREAIAWVREHGGLDAVKTHWKRISYYADPVPRSYAEKRIAKLKRQIDENHAALRRKNKRIAELEAKVRVRERANDELIAMRPRLMPEGMEWLVEAWPRFEDDSPVRLLDDFERYGEESGVSSVTMYADGSFALNCRAYSKGERVNRPAPKVLDADGVEVRDGDVLWHTANGRRFEVTGLDPHKPAQIRVKDASMELGVWDDPALYTHRAPVIAADGKPLREGQTVWHKQTGRAATVKGFDRMLGEPCAVIDFAGIEQRVSGKLLTHERPVADTWERLEEDTRMSPSNYCLARGLEDTGATYGDAAHAMARDIVRRARALAGVSE